ncbi:hypothetical protein [Ramlibacter sp. Leaf400]|uniref:hypothetical protein n=1 Tax=Ramlibacter sp. Leaf400 TaxID=1736365 RepID=UPI0007152B52|nr:hypothetical protein [Ramlibacter sp. Leaf400]KQT10988.1 hypothetical protein ASG30_09325 [Ramlibacter sp. Leaf400]
MWQQRVARTGERMRAQVRAELAATSILLHMSPVIGGLQALRAAAGAAFEMETAADLHRRLKNLPFPSEEDVASVAAHDIDCARHLVRGRKLAMQAELFLGLLVTGEHLNQSIKKMTWGTLADLLGNATGQYDAARAALEKLAPV